MRSSFLIILFFLFCTCVYAQPNPRHLEEIAYDKANNKLLIFGGIEMKKDGWAEPADVHEWDGKKWYSKDAKGPAGRRGHVWVYDESRSESMLIGGVTTGEVVKDSTIFDVWSWDGSTWKLINNACPVKEPEGAYDRIGKRILVYGDVNNKNILSYDLSAAFELWEYRNNAWRKLAADGPDITGSRMIAFDIARKRLIVPVFEGNSVTVWEWNDDKWMKTVFEKDCPPYRSKSALAYDPVSKITVLFGGLSAERKQLGDCWTWDGKQWKEIKIITGPSVRNSAHFTAGNDQLFLYGGSVLKPAPDKGIESCNELWSLKNDKWEKIK